MAKKTNKNSRFISRSIKSKRISDQPKTALQLNTLHQALAHHQAGRLAEAEALYRKILLVEPNHPEALHFLGVHALETGKNDIAVELISKALLSKPDYVEAYYNLGIALYTQGKLDEAASSFIQATSLSPSHVDAHYNLGNVLKDQGKLNEAIKSFQRVLSLKPDYVDALQNLGVTFSESGKLDESIACYRKALSLRPDYVRAFKGLAFLHKYTDFNDFIPAMEEIYNYKSTITVAERIDLGFALCKVYENIGDYDKSFKFMLDANTLKRGTYRYSFQADQNLFKRIRNAFSPGFFASSYGSGCQDGTPIFILGMPRSGTSLVEQILASHPLVFGAGELGILPALTNGLCKGYAKAPFPECVLDLDMDIFKKLGADYVDKIRKYSKDVEYITDKMPNNFVFVGLIKTILPKAKVIHCTRDPMDNCFSIFKTDFTVTHGYAYDMAELGQYYNLYRDLMDHWEKTLPGFMYTLKYEEMVSDQQSQTKNLLEFCGLPWDESCMAYHKTERRVRTASLAQVRQPIYKDSIELWRRYEKQLEPLSKAVLGE